MLVESPSLPRTRTRCAKLRRKSVVCRYTSTTPAHLDDVTDWSLPSRASLLNEKIGPTTYAGKTPTPRAEAVFVLGPWIGPTWPSSCGPRQGVHDVGHAVALGRTRHKTQEENGSMTGTEHLLSSSAGPGVSSMWLTSST